MTRKLAIFFFEKILPKIAMIYLKKSSNLQKLVLKMSENQKYDQKLANFFFKILPKIAKIPFKNS